MIYPERAEEAKLKARYPNLPAKAGGSDLLRKRLQKGVRGSALGPGGGGGVVRTAQSGSHNCMKAYNNCV